MRIIFTVSDAVDAAMAGGEVERRSAVLSIEPESTPQLVKNYFTTVREAKRKNQSQFVSMSISFEDEP